jgi:hypothetical protein
MRWLFDERLFRSFPAARGKILSVSFVPEAEVSPGFLNVGYRESCR